MVKELKLDIDEEILSFIKDKVPNQEISTKEYIEKIVCLVLEEESILVDTVSLSIEAASAEEIKQMNKAYRGIDRTTDVLSFPIFEKIELEELSQQSDADKKIKEISLGDIILCLSVIEEQSQEYKTGVLRETLYMITHAVCHLVGYDHIEESEKVVMRALEEKVLSKIGVNQADE